MNVGQGKPHFGPIWPIPRDLWLCFHLHLPLKRVAPPLDPAILFGKCDPLLRADYSFRKFCSISSISSPFSPRESPLLLVTGGLSRSHLHFLGCLVYHNTFGHQHHHTNPSCLALNPYLPPHAPHTCDDTRQHLPRATA